MIYLVVQLRTLQDYALTVCCLANNMEKQDLEENDQVYLSRFSASITGSITVKNIIKCSNKVPIALQTLNFKFLEDRLFERVTYFV